MIIAVRPLSVARLVSDPNRLSLTHRGLLDGFQEKSLLSSAELASCPISAEIMGYSNSFQLKCCGTRVSFSGINGWAKALKSIFRSPTCPFDRNADEFHESLASAGIDPTPDRPDINLLLGRIDPIPEIVLSAMNDVLADIIRMSYQ
ncbi:MAG: hypothetical protein ACI9BD_000848 [Candidatus Marinamargulisbacteria bacterium]|jgi:hypothetical protein